MFDMWRRTHTQTFPKRIKVWRRLQNDINIVDYEGIYQKSSEKSGDISIEERSLWLRRNLPPSLSKNVILGLVGFASTAFFGWLIGVVFAIVLHLPYVDLILGLIFGLIGGLIGWTTGNNKEIFEIPAPSQSAYREGALENESRDVLWILQTGLNDFHPLKYQEGAFIATITEKIPTYNWIPLTDAEGKPVLNAEGKQEHRRGDFIKFEYKQKKAVLFDTNFYLTGDKDNLVAEPVPYVVAYKNMDTYQWLLSQAERARRIYRKGTWWDKYGTTATMVIGCLFILIIFVVGLQQYNSINGTLVDGMKAVATELGKNTDTNAATLKSIAQMLANKPPVAPPV